MCGAITIEYPAVKWLNFYSTRHAVGRFFARALYLVVAALPLYALASATPVSRCAFVANAYDYSVTQYIVDESGDLQPRGQAFSVDKFPSFVMVHPNQKWAYVSSRTVDLLRAYKIDNQTCRLSELSPDSVDIKLRSPFRAAFHPSGRFLYVAGRGGAVGAYAIDLNNGNISLVPGQPFPTGERTRSVAIHPNGKFLYATNAYENTVSGFRINEQSGVLTPLKNSPYDVGEKGPFKKIPPIMPDLNVDRGALPYYVVIHPNGKFAYVTNYVANTISQFGIDNDSGELSLMGPTVVAGTTPYPIILHPNGRFAYVATWGGNDILVYAIDEKNGRLKELTALRLSDADLQRPVDLEFNRDASRLYAVNIGGDDVAQFAVNSESGAVSLRRRVHSRAGPLTISFTEAEKHAQYESQRVFAIDAEKRELYHYQVDSNTGQWQLLDATITGKDPGSVVYDPQGRVVIVSNRGDNNLTMYNIEKGGKLSRMPLSPFAVGQAPDHLKIDANGWYLYLASNIDKSLQFFLLHKDSAELGETVGSPLPLTVSTDILQLDPLARFTFALNKEKRLVSFNRSQAVVMAANTPQMEAGSPMQLDFAANLMEVDLSGRFVIFADNKNRLLRPFRIHPAVGSLHEVKERNHKLRHEIVAMKFAPLSGRILLMLSAGRLEILAFDSVSGTFKELQGQAVDASLDHLWLSASGKHVYLSAKNKHEVWVLPLSVSIQNGSDRLASVNVTLGKPVRQQLKHALTDMDFSLDVLP